MLSKFAPRRIAISLFVIVLATGIVLLRSGSISHAALKIPSSTIAAPPAPPPNTDLTGQFWFLGQGNPTDARLAYANNNNNAQTVLVDNNPTLDLQTAIPEAVGLDTASGFYFVIVSNTIADHALMLRGVIGSAAAPTIVVDFVDTVIVNTLYVDPINHKIYVCYQDGSGSAPTNTGIRVYGYDPATGAVTDQGFLVTKATSTKPQEGGFDVFDPRDFAVDTATNNLFFTERLSGGVNSTGIFRLNIGSPNNVDQLVSQAQFPDNFSNGYFVDVEVDRSTGLVYFDTYSQHPFPDAGYNANFNAIWVISETATGGTATKVTLSGLPAGNHFYPGDMVLDPSTRQLYVGNEETDAGNAATDDVINVFQLNAAGTSATLVNTIAISPTWITDLGNIGGMAFDTLPTLPSLGATSTHPVEQSTAVNLLSAAPAITDDGGYLVSAAVTVSGSFVGSGDTLSVNNGATSGTIPGTNLVIAVTTDASGNKKLTLTGYDTLAHYQTVLAGAQFQATGDNPTNYGANTTRTITWQINDGAAGTPVGTTNGTLTNIRTSSITIDGVNDAPVNTVPGGQSVNEDTNLIVAGLSVTDPDANPTTQQLTTTLGVLHGTITAASAGGAAVTNSGTASVTLTGTRNQINTTLAAVGNIVYKGVLNYNSADGAETLTVTTNDGGNTGTGGAKQDVDTVAITVNGINDPPSFTKGADQTALAGVAKTVAGWATNISAGSANESGQTLTFSSPNNNNAIFSVQPAIDSTGQLTYTPAVGAIGSATVTVTLSDNGGGTNTSPSQTFSITVTNTATWTGATNSDWSNTANWTPGSVPGSSNNVSLPSTGVTTQPAIPPGSFSTNSLTIAAGRTLGLAGGNLTVSGVLTMSGGDITVNTGSLLTIASTGSITRTSGVVIGPIQKLFGGVGSFTYPVGTTGGVLSQVDATVTAGSGQLTVTANTGTAPATTPPLVTANTLQRYWDLNGSGITVDVTWHYLQTDVNGTEANYRIIRIVSGGTAISVPNGSPCPGTGSPCVDTTANTIFAKGLTSFSLWTAGANLVTAAKVAITGRVVRPDGLMAVRSLVSITDDHGNVRFAKTNPFGYFRFQDVETGQGYVINAIDKRFEFAPQFVSVTDNMSDLILTLQPRP